jgi:hypothetical protein
MTIEDLAHRMAWRYRKSSDPSHSDTYTFNRETLLLFAAAVQAAEREQCGLCKNQMQGSWAALATAADCKSVAFGQRGSTP